MLFWVTHERVTLEGVDDDRVLVEIVDRQRREMDSSARLLWERLARRDGGPEYLSALRVVRHSFDAWAGIDEVGARLGRDVLREPPNHAERVLVGVPT